MTLTTSQLYSKISYNNNSAGGVIEKSSLSLPSALDFCGRLKIRVFPMYKWNKFVSAKAVPSIARHYRSLKESLDYDKDHHISVDPQKISKKKSVEKGDSSFEPVENILVNILLIDDDRDILFTFKSILEAEGYNVQAFADPNEALGHFSQTDPSYYNLILTDIRMPNFNGFQLYQKLREINTGIKVIFMTAFDVPGNLSDTVPTIKESDIIKKPIEEEHFVNKVREALKRNHNRVRPRTSQQRFLEFTTFVYID
jgi:FixJ family two-component response regulator